ncbi:MAG: FmdB family zinc ribbon protein [Chloroflexota bacterium]
MYEFVCRDCDRRFDSLVRNLEAAERITCASCGGSNIRRLVSGFAMLGGGSSEPMPAPANAGGGGCCGGSCGCGN